LKSFFAAVLPARIRACRDVPVNTLQQAFVFDAQMKTASRSRREAVKDLRLVT
jgi:hypothetical protein